MDDVDGHEWLQSLLVLMDGMVFFEDKWLVCLVLMVTGLIPADGSSNAWLGMVKCGGLFGGRGEDRCGSAVTALERSTPFTANPHLLCLNTSSSHLHYF